MKPDCLTPEQWAAVLAISGTPIQQLARRMGHGFLRCGNCAERQRLNAHLIKKYLAEGWPHCCEGTLQGGTMGYYSSEENLKKELAVLAAGEGEEA